MAQRELNRGMYKDDHRLENLFNFFLLSIAIAFPCPGIGFAALAAEETAAVTNLRVKGVAPTSLKSTCTGAHPAMDGNCRTPEALPLPELPSSHNGVVAERISSYAVGGTQHITVTSGNASRTIWNTKGAATIVVFGLPTAESPPERHPHRQRR